ncbi:MULTISPECIES: hypothetical protein [Rhodobacterales]|uniref:hypothetical protein n=1 Tax=Roseobacter sp. N2S TaxID=2663844 RepID=UPI00285A168B|nr:MULTISPECIES: hypothetical protein [Rhodobacterales]MDR6265154.1 hypothetical protein [Roseobacter sp. N2S]
MPQVQIKGCAPNTVVPNTVATAQAQTPNLRDGGAGGENWPNVGKTALGVALKILWIVETRETTIAACAKLLHCPRHWIGA